MKRIYTFKKQSAPGPKKAGSEPQPTTNPPGKPVGSEMREQRELKRAAKSGQP
jgi:hypothetical protein